MSIDVFRAIRELIPNATLIHEPSPLDDESRGAYGEGPALVQAECAEGSVMRAHRVDGDPVARFAGFLDGIQRTQIMAHDGNGIPVMYGTVAAAIRERRNRRFVAWQRRAPIVERRLYVPLELVDRRGVTSCAGIGIVDTSRNAKGALVSRHPGELRAVALERIRADREHAERRLAEAWCSMASEPLFVDGGISSSAVVATATCVVGVVKSHAKLFADDVSLAVVMRLRKGERSSVFRIRPRDGRAEVLSWYLRVRDNRERDAMFGLVRVECACCDDIANRAAEVSRWVLAESSPIALPDNRWDRMAYGIRDCEEFLRAVAS